MVVTGLHGCYRVSRSSCHQDTLPGHQVERLPGPHTIMEGLRTFGTSSRRSAEHPLLHRPRSFPPRPLLAWTREQELDDSSTQRFLLERNLVSVYLVRFALSAEHPENLRCPAESRFSSRYSGWQKPDTAHTYSSS